MKNFKWYLKCSIVFLLLIVPILVYGIFENNYSKNNVAYRWSNDKSSAHMGVYIAKEQAFSITDVYKFREVLKNELKKSDAHINKKGNDTWTDCYSSKSTVTLSDGLMETEITAYGVGGDFFLFHPITLVGGSYFLEDNDSKDLVVLDEDMAWRYFGSTDIEGMEIYINKKLHIISGVIKREEGMFQASAGNGKPSIYMSYSSLADLTKDLQITNYEVVMPNLTKDYAKKIVKKNIGISNNNYEMVEWSERYSFEALLSVIKNIGNRSMQTKAIIYPYWENSAKAIEDIWALVIGVWFVFTGITGIYTIIKLVSNFIKNKDKIGLFVLDKIKMLVGFYRKIYTTIFKKNIV